MRIYLLPLLPLLLVGMVSAQADSALPELVKIEQDTPKKAVKLSLPKPHFLGPIIPGLNKQGGAIPQGLAYWPKKDWLLVSCYFDDGRSSVVVVLENKEAGKMKHCLTLVEENGKGHTGHVGGVAVSEKYLWIGSGPSLYRASLADIEAVKEKTYDRLRLQKPFNGECGASYVSYHNKRVWVGEFVSLETEHKGKKSHYLEDRNGKYKYAWVAGYALDGNEDLVRQGGQGPRPAAVLSVRQKVQGIAFMGEHIILSMSHGRKNKSALAVYPDPFHRREKSLVTAKLEGGGMVPVWFLDGKNQVGKDIEFPPMSEGITPVGKHLGVVFESGAEKYKVEGHVPVKNVIFVDPFAGK